MCEKQIMSSPSGCSRASAGLNQAAVSSARFHFASPSRSARRYAADIKRRVVQEAREQPSYSSQMGVKSCSPSCAWGSPASRRWMRSLLRQRLCRCPNLVLVARGLVDAHNCLHCVHDAHVFGCLQAVASVDFNLHRILTAVRFRRRTP